MPPQHLRPRDPHTRSSFLALSLLPCVLPLTFHSLMVRGNVETPQPGPPSLVLHSAAFRFDLPLDRQTNSRPLLLIEFPRCSSLPFPSPSFLSRFLNDDVVQCSPRRLVVFCLPITLTPHPQSGPLPPPPYFDFFWPHPGLETYTGH